MVIPSGHKRIRKLELKEKAVITQLWKPVYKIQNVFQGIGAFDADSAVTESGGFFAGKEQLFFFTERGNLLVRRSRSQKTEAQGI